MMTLCVCLSVTTLAGFVGWRVERKLRRRAERAAGHFVAELSQAQQDLDTYKTKAQRDEGILDMLARGGIHAYRTFCVGYRPQRRTA